MKKMMIAAAIVCAAVLANAASFEWSADGYNGSNWEDGYIEDCKAYLFLGTVTASDSAFNLGSATELDWSLQDSSSYNFGSEGVVKSSENLKSDAAGQAYSIVIVEDNGKSIGAYEGYYAILTGTTKHEVDPMDEKKTWASMINGTVLSQGDWKTMAAAPEPTSGLLLLLGVAGLALRRRRA